MSQKCQDEGIDALTHFNGPEYLFRGVSEYLHNENLGKLMPRGHFFEITFKADGSIIASGQATAGDSEKNAVLGHQLNSRKFETSGISTTPFFERAIYYATHTRDGKPTNGYVYKIAWALLWKFKIKKFVVSDYVEHPKIPEDSEVILVSHDNGPLSKEIMIEVIKVTA